MVVCTLKQPWEVGLRSTYRRCRFWKKKSSFQMKLISILAGKQAKLLRLGHRKPAHIRWKADEPKTCHCFVRIEEKNWKIELATFGFNRTALRATQPKLHWLLCTLFLKIALSAAELMSLATSELWFDTVGLLFVECRQR